MRGPGAVQIVGARRPRRATQFSGKPRRCCMRSQPGGHRHHRRETLFATVQSSLMKCARLSLLMRCGQPAIRKQQAIWTAWRIIKDWIEAQLALVEVTVPQVFLPYAVLRDGRALTEHVVDDPKFLLKTAIASI